MPHLPLKALVPPPGNDWGDSRSMLAIDPAKRTACVFVHGWGGNATETWLGFPAYIRDSVKAEGTDFFFFDYDSLSLGATFSAALLRQFIDALLNDPAGLVINPALADQPRFQRDPGFRYERLIVCAHSMGAVVSRRALLDLESEAPGRFHDLRLSLLLFAPAHKGTDLVRLGRDVLSGSFLGIPLNAIRGAVLAKFKSLLDLETGSPVLDALERDNAAARAVLVQAGKADACYRATVLHAEHDDVVRQEGFDRDKPLEPVLLQTHTSICKPTSSFPLPFTRLESLL